MFCQVLCKLPLCGLLLCFELYFVEFYFVLLSFILQAEDYKCFVKSCVNSHFVVCAVF